MAKFPVYRTEATISGRPQAVRANIDVDTGEGAVAQAIGGLGGAIQDLGIKYDIMDARTQFNDSSIKAAEAIDKYFLELEGIDDPTKYNERLNQLYVDLGKIAPTNKRALRIYNNNINQQRLKIAQDTREMPQVW